MRTAEEILKRKLNIEKLSFSQRVLVVPAMEEYASQFKPKWISVNDEFPTQGQNVIMAYKFGVGEAKFINGNFCMPREWHIIFPDVTLWMPLPEKPTT